MAMKWRWRAQGPLALLSLRPALEKSATGSRFGTAAVRK
jgi:hypothetical protein